MPQQVTAFSVMISAPGDMKGAVDEIRDALVTWNSTHLHRGAVMVPLDWKRDSVPNLGASGQAIINEQLLSRADILFAVFGARLGTPTEKYVSGTAEEIHEAHKEGKPVHIYFHAGDLPHDVDLDEVKALRAFKSKIQDIGLYGQFHDISDLRHQVWQAIEADVHSLLKDSKPRAVVSGAADLIVQPGSEQVFKGTDTRGKATYKTKRWIEVINRGVADAEEVMVESVHGGHLWINWPKPTVIYAGKSRRAPFDLTLGGSSPSVKVTWRDGEDTRSEVFDAV